MEHMRGYAETQKNRKFAMDKALGGIGVPVKKVSLLMPHSVTSSDMRNIPSAHKSVQVIQARIVILHFFQADDFFILFIDT